MKNLAYRSFWALAPVVAAPPHSIYSRFQDLLADYRLEEKIVRDRQKEIALQPRSPDFKDYKALSPSLKIEWALRLGLSRYPYSLGELGAIPDPTLVDEGLQAWLDSQILRSFLKPLAWIQLKGQVRSFLKSSPLRAPLLAGPQASTWRYFLGESGGKSYFSGLDFWELAQKQNGVEKIDMLMKARQQIFLSSDFLGGGLQEFDEHCISTLVKEWGPSPRLAQAIYSRSVLEAKSDSRIALLKALHDYFQKAEQMRLAADALSRIQLIRLEKREALSAAELLEVAEMELSAGEFALSRSLFQGVLKGADVEISRFERMRALAGLAIATRREAEHKQSRDLLEWAANYHVEALNENDGTDYGNMLLESYAEILQQLRYPQEALNIWESLFQKARLPEFKVRALGQAADLQLRLLGDKLLSEVTRLNSFKKYLATLGFLREWDSRSSAYRNHVKEARVWQKKLGLQKDPETQASFNELEAR